MEVFACFEVFGGYLACGFGTIQVFSINFAIFTFTSSTNFPTDPPQISSQRAKHKKIKTSRFAFKIYNKRSVRVKWTQKKMLEKVPEKNSHFSSKNGNEIQIETNKKLIFFSGNAKFGINCQLIFHSIPNASIFFISILFYFSFHSLRIVRELQLQSIYQPYTPTSQCLLLIHINCLTYMWL